MENTAKLLFRDLLHTFKNASGNWRSTPLTGFSCLRGNQFDNGLLVVGRSVNGWISNWIVDELDDENKVDEIVEQHYPTNSPPDCPMKWIYDLWGDSVGKYNTKRSAFWRVSGAVTCALTGEQYDECRWPSSLSWSNLYKVSPGAGGNPSNTLVNIQKDYCQKILKEEIKWLNPSQILFLTGWGWAQWFLPDLQFVKDKTDEVGIEASGTIFNQARVVVLPHPQGKAEQPLVAAAVNYFRSHPSGI